MVTVTEIDVVQAWQDPALEHERILACCAFSPCGQYLAAGGQHEVLLLWELETGKKTTVSGHQRWITSVVFHPDRERLFSADCGGTIHCWRHRSETSGPEWTRAGNPGHMRTEWIHSLRIAPDGNLLSAGNDRVIRLWSADDGRPLREFTGHEYDIYSLAVHPDGRSLVSGDLSGRVLQWDFASGGILRTLDAGILHARGEDFLADVGGVRSLAFDREGTLLACGGMTDITSNTFCPGKPAVLIFDWESGALTQTLRPKQNSDGPINSVVFLPDGTVAGHAEHLNGVSSLEFWRPGRPEPLHTIVRESGYCMDVHPDGVRLSVASFRTNGSGGNGRNSPKDEYAAHKGEIAIFHLHAKPL